MFILTWSVDPDNWKCWFKERKLFIKWNKTRIELMIEIQMKQFLSPLFCFWILLMTSWTIHIRRFALIWKQSKSKTKYHPTFLAIYHFCCNFHIYIENVFMYSLTETIYDLQAHHDIWKKKSKTFYDIDTQLNAKCWSVTYSYFNSSTYVFYELYCGYHFLQENLLYCTPKWI